ncbi:BirA family biotin operon repressor/biotin-[acetyl-CoA-carboxylase] ligase [Pedobacter sp. UYP24]
MSKSEPLAEGTVIMADDQFAGRGQQGNSWLSKPGLNLTFSIYLRPNFLNVGAQFSLNIAVSIGIRNALSTFIPHGISIKWPNDIYFNDKKIGGVLIENTLLGSGIKSSIIGIGINVNQQSFEEDQLKRASSLSEILQQDVDLMELLNNICHAIEVEYLKLRAGKADDHHSNYLKNLYRFGKPSIYKQKELLFEGTITNVMQTGQLVMVSDGEELLFNFKEVEFFDNN